MSRPLRGGCQCGRNSYIINLPETGAELAQVLFDTDPRHRIFQASPIAAFIRVPLSWYRSSTLPFFPDETNSVIRRTYTHPTQQSTKRGFCGFCGTPLSYWSEEPAGEADYIRLTLGSLCSEDLGDLEDLGLVPSDPEDSSSSSYSVGGSASPSRARGGDDQPRSVAETTTTRESSQRGGGGGDLVSRETLGVPWFDSFVAGSRLGKLRKSRGGGQSRDGRVRYEWEVVEWTGGSEDAGGAEGGDAAPSPTKRAKHDDGGSGGGVTTVHR